MITLAEHMIVAGADNHPPMLEKTIYNSWQNCMLLYIKGKEHGRMMLNSIEHGPLVYGTIEVDGVTRTKTYEELTDAEKLQDDCDSYEAPSHYPQYKRPIIPQQPPVPQNVDPSPTISQQPQAEFPQLDSGLAVPSFLLSDDPIASLNKAMAFLTTAITSRETGLEFRWRRPYGKVLDEEQLAFLADPRVAERQDTQTTITHNDAFQTDDLDAFDSDCDEAPGAKAVLMANLSSYDSDVISEMYYSEQPAFDPASDIEITSDNNIISYDQYLKETESAAVQNTTSIEQQNAVIMLVFDEITHRIAKCNVESNKNKNKQESLTTELEKYKERVRMFEERQKVDLNAREKYIDSQMNDMILNKNAKFVAFQKEIDTLKFSLSKHVKENKFLMTTIDVLKKQTKEKEDKYNEELKRVDQNDPVPKEKKINISPINYSKLNKLSKHFGKHFVPQKELSAEQAFWLPISNPISEQLVVQPTPVKIEAPSELPKCSVDKKCFEIQKKELLLENDRLLELIISQDLVHTAVNSLEVINECESLRKRYSEEYNRNLTPKAELSKMSKLSKTCSRLQNHCISLELKLQQHKVSFQNNRSYSNLDAPALNEFFVINDLKAQLQAKESSISKLRAHIATLKGKNVSDNNEPVNNASVIALGMFRLDLEPLSRRLKNNREAHEDYLQKTKKHTDTLRVIASTSASGSQSKSNTRKNRITQAAISNKKNKVEEVHPRKIMSSPNKRNLVSMCNANFKHVVKDANSKQDFTINETKYSMTRITSNPIVPPKETSQTPVITSNPEVKVYHRRTKVAKSISINDDPSILRSWPSNILEPNKNWGSAVSNSPSSSRVQCRSSKSSSDTWTQDT
ncbi:hypothetical protein Tco_0823485 [Tanacetum coccineum]|uniref:Integrase, catalytic region, zinc finger, CCHC-type, peptidase aspartic, catalytic n=1 Tax=Tanacetum coccineum TaxID=301880 RepID=A0ABQ5AI09_9ASTR